VKGELRLRAAHYRTGEVQEFLLRGDRVAEIRSGTRGRTGDLQFGPGLLDLQCNGFAGVDFNHSETTIEEVRESIRALWRHGCTSVLPTIITGTVERMESFFHRLGEALHDPSIAKSVPGFHLEGPFISPEEGARGAHPLHAVRPAEKRLWQRLQRAADGRIRLLTLAPEVRGALPLIRLLRSEGVLPALGHTMATAREVSDAADAGALMSTHLGNGCPQSIARHANPIFAQLGEDRLAASVIPDGIHLPPEVLRSIARAKGRTRTVLVTDAMAAAGAPPGRYRLGEMMVEVGTDRVVRQPGSPNLAGSALTMDDAVARYTAMTGEPLAESWDAASVRPAALLKRADTRKRVDLGTIIVDASGGGFRVIATLRGKRVLWREGA
jgi:N-acetylglucosamine-6-phosphate deacetylase